MLPLRILLMYTFLAGVQSIDDLTELVGNVEVANTLYDDFVVHQDDVRKDAEYSAGYMKMLIAMEGLGTLGVKFETYTCEVKLCTRMYIVAWHLVIGYCGSYKLALLYWLTLLFLSFGEATWPNCNLLTISLIDIFNFFFLPISFIFAGLIHRFPWVCAYNDPFLWWPEWYYWY